MERIRSPRRFLLFLLLSVSIPLASFYGYVAFTANFGTIVSGAAYRSAQMSPSNLAETVKKHRIKTVLNLRGHHPEADWYRDEVRSVVTNGASQIDVALSSSEWMSRYQALTLVEILESAERPILIHCFHGSERTGLVSAFLQLLQPGSTLEDAKLEFSVRHLFVPVGDGVRMPEHLAQYERWLEQHHLEHSPSQFREWIIKEYRPGTPSREDWPYDPYPLRVVTRPSTEGKTELEIETRWAPGSEPGSPARATSRSPKEIRIR